MQGASYFRAIGQAMVYGLSARAVAIGTGAPEPEEFPRFTRVRLHRAIADGIRIEALIDSLDMQLASGAISEKTFDRLVAKWENAAAILSRIHRPLLLLAQRQQRAVGS